MKTIEEITQEIESKKKEFNSEKTNSADKQEFFNGVAELLTHVSDYLVEELKHDNKVEVTNFPQSVKEVKVTNFRGIFGLLESISKAIKKFKLPEIFKVQGEVTVKNQVSVPEIKFPEPVKTVGVSSLPEYIKEYLEKIAKKDLKIEVKAPEVSVQVPETKVEVNLSVLEELIQTNNELLKALDKPQKEIDLTIVERAVSKTTEAIQELRFPVPSFTSSWQKSLTMQAEDLGKSYGWTTAGGKDVVEYVEFVGIDGIQYRKTYTYDDMGRVLTESTWVKQ